MTWLPSVGELLKAKRLATTFSKTQIDRLGDRLREGSAGEADLRLLDDYRRSFGEAYETVVRTIRERLQLELTGRPAKSTSSIMEKLGRETIRLSQIQDIAGCRIVLANVTEQERVVASLRALFSEASIVDRRANPSHGYRAVHIIARISGKLIELQVRSPLQHLWAELSEKFSDIIDPSVKYGGGEDHIRQMLTERSGLMTDIEETEIMMAGLPKQHLNEQQAMALQELQTRIVQVKENLINNLNQVVRWLENQKGQKG